jgi:chromosome partitioning protein
MKTLAIVCQKGGVGKSTTAVNLGAGLSFTGQKVLFIDLDAQGNLTETLGGGGDVTAMEVLTGEATAAEALRRVALGGLIPAGPHLAGADMIVSGAKREYRLRDALAPLREKYDYAIIDTPPSLGILTVNALTAAMETIVPVQADVYSLRAIGKLSLTIEAVRAHCNNALSIGGILLTRHSARAILSRDMAEMMEQTATALRTKIFTSSIREAIAIKESQVCQQDIFTYAPKSGVARDYQNFVAEYLAGHNDVSEKKLQE